MTRREKRDYIDRAVAAWIKEWDDPEFDFSALRQRYPRAHHDVLSLALVEAGYPVSTKRSLSHAAREICSRAIAESVWTLKEGVRPRR